MFTDQPVTPTRLETLIQFLQARSAYSTETVCQLLAPGSIVEDEHRNSVNQTIRAAGDLGLVEDDGHLRLRIGKGRSAREAILAALDERVLSSLKIEPYFAPHYAIMLAETLPGSPIRSREDWVSAFRATPYGAEQSTNPFNKDKVTGITRWLSYAGLTWADPAGELQPNPYERIERQLPKIFAEARSLGDTEFMAGLAQACPELDGGEIFRRVRPNYDDERRVCSLGVAHALVELHLDDVIRLHASADSNGWSLEFASPPNAGTMAAPRLDKVEWLR